VNVELFAEFILMSSLCRSPKKIPPYTS
jgi:hypothetical protein